LVQCLCFTLNWVSKGFWCYDCLTLQTTLSYHQWLLIADSTKVVSALLALSGRDNVGAPFRTGIGVGESKVGWMDKFSCQFL
jgi:hypothetical protein